MDRYFSNDVNHSVAPALIGQEIYDPVDVTPGGMFHHIVVYWGRCFRNGYTLSSLCTRNTQHCHPTLRIGGNTFRIIYVGGVFEFSQSGRIISSLRGLAKKVAGHQGLQLQKVVGPDEKL